MNHDVLSEDEDRHAVRCLGGTGLLEVLGERFRLTSAGTRLRAFGRRARYFPREPDQYLVGLQRLGSPQPSGWVPRLGAVGRAYTEYSHRLASLAESHAGGVRWPVHNATKAPTFMDGWCNGTAGHLLLHALADDVLRSEASAELVARAGESMWATEMQLGTLCCGLAGISYALAAAHRVTDSDVWLERARAVSRRAAADRSEHFYRDALYKGAVGVAVLTEDLRQPTSAAMPLFEPAP